MTKRIVKAALAPLLVAADENAGRVGEVLMGMTVDVLDEKAGWLHAQDSWGTEGYLASDAVNADDAFAKEWEAYGKMGARTPWVDVLVQPDKGAALLTAVPRGGMVHPVGEQEEAGYLSVAMPNGQKGWAKVGNLMPYIPRKRGLKEHPLREALGTGALSYLGAQYRKGGRTMQGVDSFGLVSMTYFLNGVDVPAKAAEMTTAGFNLIDKGQLAMGDILCFGAHMTLYLGDNNYIHSTSKEGSDGVVINSIDAESPFYRMDLAEKLSGCYTLFV